MAFSGGVSWAPVAAGEEILERTFGLGVGEYRSPHP
jgi:hypothetical protein